PSAAVAAPTRTASPSPATGACRARPAPRPAASPGQGGVRRPRWPYPKGYTNDPMEAAPTLREARTAAGLSQAQLAERAGTSQATVSAYETGTKEPSVATFSRLLAVAG